MFANILFAGPCNARCPFCIGQRLDPRLSRNNLDEFPPAGLDRFIELVRALHIHEISLSGTTTDPQLYRHEARLLAELRARLGRETRFSLHTNGRLALRKLDTFNLYDRVTLSLPSFDPATYQRMMGVPGVPDLAAIQRHTRRPVKISTLVTDDNAPEIPALLGRCQELGLRRIVLRKCYGDPRPWDHLLDLPALHLWPSGHFRGNPVYALNSLEITLWDFQATSARALNLFSNGEIYWGYRLMEANAKLAGP